MWPADQEIRQDLSTRISPDGRLFVASSGGTYIEVVDVDTGERLWGRDFGGEGITRATFTHDGSEVVATYGWSSTEGSPTMDVTTEAALGVHLLDATSGDPLRQFPTGVCGVVTSPLSMTAVGAASDSFLVTELGDHPSCVYNGSRVENINPGDADRPHTFLIDLASGDTRQLSTIRPEAGQAPQVLVSANGGTLLLADLEYFEDRPATRVVDRSSGEEVAVVEGWPASASADGSIVLTLGPGVMFVWDVGSGQPEEPSAVVETQLADLTPDGAVVVAVQASSFLLSDSRTGEELDRLLTGLGSNQRPSYSTDGSRIMVSEVFGATAAVFDFDAARELASVQLCPELGIRGFVEVAGNTTAVRASRCPGTEHPTQFLIDSDSYEVKASVAPSGGWQSALTIDGLLLADQYATGVDTLGRIRLHDPETGEELATLEGMCEHTFTEFAGCVPFPDTPFPDWPWNLAFSSDGSLLAMAGDNSDGVSVYDIEAGRIVATPTVPHETRQQYRGQDVAFSPDGTRLAASFGDAPFELWLLSTDDWAPITNYVPPVAGRAAEVAPLNLLFTPDGGTLIANDFVDVGEGRIVFMDGATLEHLDQINAHDGGIIQLALNPEGTLLASAGFDGFVRVWDVETRTLVHQIPVTSDGSNVGGVAFMEDGRHLSVTSPSTGDLHLVTIDVDELLDIARSRVTRSFTDTECATYRIDPCPTLEDIKIGSA
jgi:WD40 repeat protein